MAIRKLRDLEPAKPAEKAGLPSAADLDAVAAEQKTKQATGKKKSPLSTPLAQPETPVQSAQPGASPASAVMPPSYLTLPEGVNWTDPKLDTTKKDSQGNEKTDLGDFGPKGKNPPPDVETDAERQTAADAREARLNQNMASTVKTDSVGNVKGRFVVTPQGHDEHGMRLPDKVDRSQVVEAPVYVGPRGIGAPQDTFHGARPAKK